MLRPQAGRQRGFEGETVTQVQRAYAATCSGCCSGRCRAGVGMYAAHPRDAELRLVALIPKAPAAHRQARPPCLTDLGFASGSVLFQVAVLHPRQPPKQSGDHALADALHRRRQRQTAVSGRQRRSLGRRRGHINAMRMRGSAQASDAGARDAGAPLPCCARTLWSTTNRRCLLDGELSLLGDTAGGRVRARTG